MQVDSTAVEDSKETIRKKKEVQQPTDAHGNWLIRPYTPAPESRCPPYVYLYPMEEIRPWVPEDDGQPVSHKTQSVNTLAMSLDPALAALHSVEIMLSRAWLHSTMALVTFSAPPACIGTLAVCCHFSQVWS